MKKIGTKELKLLESVKVYGSLKNKRTAPNL